MITPAVNNLLGVNTGVTFSPITVEVDGSNFNPINGNSSLPGDGYCRAYSVANYPGTTYNWSTYIPGQGGMPGYNATICSGNGSNQVYVKAYSLTPNFYLRVSYNNECGYGVISEKYIKVNGSGGTPTSVPEKPSPSQKEILIFPNPIDESLFVRKPDNDESIITNFRIISILTGKEMLHIEQIHGSELELQLSDVPKGLYIIHYSVDQYEYKMKIMKR